MYTNINHFNSRKEYMKLVYHNSNPFDFWEEVRKFHKEREQEEKEKEYDQH